MSKYEDEVEADFSFDSEGDENSVAKPKKEVSYLLYLINQYYASQKIRISLGNQSIAMEKSANKNLVVKGFNDEFHRLEKDIAKAISKEVKQHPMWKCYFKGVKGIGPVFAGVLLATIDITKAQHVSSVWKYAGLAVDANTGEADRRRKGEKISWNPFLKKTCYLIGCSFIKTKGKYRTIYDTSKEFYRNKFPNEVKIGNRTKYSKGHIHALAMRRATKLFLAEMWAFWREMEHLPVSVSFAERIGVHKP